MHVKWFLISFIFILTVGVNKPVTALENKVSKSWHSHQFEVMGTLAKVEFESANQKLASQLIKDVVGEMERIDRVMSPYKPNSELTQINENAAKGAMKISQEMFDILARSHYFAELTHGAFDISFSSVGYLYNYREQVKPTASQIDQLRSAINYRNIQLNPQTQEVFFTDKRVKIDLGGIGKGYAVDRSIQILQRHGIQNAFVNAGGDSRIIGRKNSRLWYIGIKHPRNPDKLLANMPLENVALSTSGDYERFFELEGKRYHHIIDPKTGDSAREIQSATIIADDSITADALSTSVFVLGVKEGMALVNAMPNVSAIIVNNKGKLLLSKDLTPAE
ncbi:FAD:protein FMN transferase [Aliikangiella sp. IMCC44632]